MVPGLNPNLEVEAPPGMVCTRLSSKTTLASYYHVHLFTSQINHFHSLYRQRLPGQPSEWPGQLPEPGVGRRSWGGQHRPAAAGQAGAGGAAAGPGDTELSLVHTITILTSDWTRAQCAAPCPASPSQPSLTSSTPGTGPSS